MGGAVWEVSVVIFIVRSESKTTANMVIMYGIYKTT